MASNRRHLLRRVHRYLSYILGLQLLLWLMGGVVFAWIPFDSIVKGGAARNAIPSPALPADWRETLATLPSTYGETTSLRTVASAQGALLVFAADDDPHWLRFSDGAIDQYPTASQVREFARTVYAGSAPIGEAIRIDEPEARVFGFVEELYGRSDVWQVEIDDWLNTRFYFDGPTGVYQTVRNDAWVIYDTFWRLHIMDYGEGEDFNNLFISVFSISALLFAITGIALGTQQLWRRRRH